MDTAAQKGWFHAHLLNGIDSIGGLQDLSFSTELPSSPCPVNLSL